MRLARHSPALGAAAIAVGWLLSQAGARFVNPVETGWLLAGDWAAAFLGWAFFRSAAWGWPLGENPGYPFPVGSTIAYSDAIPAVAVLLKPFGPLLPDDFQYLGLWLVACFALQGFVGAKLTALATASRVQQVLGGALFALAPPLLHRVLAGNTGHASLSAHGLVLAFLWLALAPAPAGAPGLRRRFALAAALLLLASGVHPYLVVMGLALSTAALARVALVDRVVNAPVAAAALAALVAIAAGGMVAFGFIGSGARGAAEGFGYFSADLLALLAPIGWSRLWSGAPIGNGQYEGFAYLGAGGVLLVVAAIVLARRVPGRALRFAAPAAIAAVLLALLALSSRVTLAGTALVDLGWDRLVPQLAAVFRSTGRFVWPLHYGLLLAAIAVVTYGLRARPRAATAVLAAALALQVVDVRPPDDAGLEFLERPPSPAWEAARGAYRHVALHPPVLMDGSGSVAPASCGGIFWPGYAWLGAIAARLGATYNSAYVARIDPDVGAACEAFAARLRAGELDPETIYVVHPSTLPLFRAAGATCGPLDGLVACVAGTRGTTFGEILARSGNPAP